MIVRPDSAKGDFTSLQPALDALPPTGSKIFVKAGVYLLLATVAVNLPYVNIQGEGMGITAFVADAALTGNTPAFEVQGSVPGQARALVADTARGDTTIQTSGSDAATFDQEITTKHTGEVKRISALDPVSGVLTFDDQLFDTYTPADAAHVVCSQCSKTAPCPTLPSPRTRPPPH